jgi:predicted house-cleaning NTP pyrophosphatase (Maf/HAM1 superfamily)
MSGLVFAALLSLSAQATDSNQRAHNIQAAATFFDESALLEVVQEQAPARYDFLMDLRETDEDRYLAQLHWDGHILVLEHADPRVPEIRQDLWTIDSDIEVVADEWAVAKGKDRRELQALLADLAQERVELNTRLLEIQAENMLERLNKLDTRLDHVNETKAARRIVRRAMRRAE